MKPTFEPTEDGFEIIDRIERHRYRLTTHKPVSPKPVKCDKIQYPVDSAIEITTDTVTLPTNTHVYVRRNDGLMVTEVKPNQQKSLPKGDYTLDLSGPLKVYSNVNGSVNIYSDSERTHISFNDKTRVVIGARSLHTQPARTITTTSNPNDVMRAVSMFGSALKTTTAERSYPTLRGHPPAMEVGDQLKIPSDLERPETGIRIEVPSTLKHIFVVVPLAYYLGAEVVPGSEPQLITDRGYQYALTGENGFESSVKRILKRTFFLDCIVRTEGMTPIPLYEREMVESLLEFDVGTVYEYSIAKQLETYCNIPIDAIEPHIPEWRLETKLKPKADIIEFLPFVTARLSTIDVLEESKESRSSIQDQVHAISEFTRNDSSRSTDSVRCGDPTAESEGALASSTIQQVWTSQTSSEITSTAPVSAFQNGVCRNPREDPIEIEVVCNDPAMREEVESVDGTYGNREELPFEITVHHDTTTEGLKQILATESDFLHYIGHIDNDGFQCTNGKLDVSCIEKTNIKAFFLNACKSHKQGLFLIEAGSIGGIVTIGDVVNNGAIRIGETIAQLLNHGFPLYGALDIARNKSVIGQQYLVVGDGMITIAQSETDIPNVCIAECKEDLYSIKIKTYDTIGAERGSVFTPYIDPIEEYYIVPGATGEILLEKDQFQKFLNQGSFPVLLDKTIYWSDEM
jgi:hypothetical protein